MRAKTTGKDIVVKILLGGVAVLVAGFLLPGVHIDTWLTGFLLAALLILINVTIKPLMVVLTLPLTILTLGLFLLVINALTILLAEYIIPGFVVENFWWALLFAIVLSLINALFGNNLSTNK